MMPAPCDFLGENRAAHHQHRDRVRCRAGDQQRGEHGDVTGQLQHECHRGQWRPHRAPHHRRHAGQGPQPSLSGVNPVGLDGAERSSHDEQRGEDAARRSGAERDGPDERFGDQ